MEKDYSLLRLFDLEAAKRGEAVTCNNLGTVLHYVAGPDVDRTVCVKYEGGQFCLYKLEKLHMVPLCWVEGRPVYNGDVLYHVDAGRGTAFSFDGQQILFNFDRWPDDEPCGASPCRLTWTPPKVRREIKMLATITDDGFLRWVEEGSRAHKNAESGRLRFVPSEDKVIVLEE